MRILPLTNNQVQNKSQNKAQNQNFNALMYLSDKCRIWFKDVLTEIEDLNGDAYFLFKDVFERRNNGIMHAFIKPDRVEEARKLLLQAEAPSIEVDMRDCIDEIECVKLWNE